jgi:hypothetical protein
MMVVKPKKDINDRKMKSGTGKPGKDSHAKTLMPGQL